MNKLEKRGDGMSKKVLVICGTGVATSTVVMGKLREFLKQKNIDAKLTQSKVSDAIHQADAYDLIVSTTLVPDSLKSKVLSAVPLLTGIGRDKFYEDLEAALTR
jgi:PTS system galactitol-specific IIB component